MAVSDQIICPALKKLGVLATGENPSAQEQTDVLGALNMMIDSFSLERLFIPAILRESFSLVAGQQTYQMGSGAPDFNTVRPQKITNALVQAYGVNPVAELPMRIINKDEYASIIVKSIQSTIPICLYNDNAYPYCNLSIWPVSSVVTPMILYSQKQLSDFAAATSAVSLPPGYLELLIYNLAVRIAPDFGVPAPEDVVALAVSSMERAKRANWQPTYLGVDAALRGPKGTFNWVTGDTT
jgi:hypothetical protein